MTQSTTPVLGVVLAGGRSSRMGRDKALLQWHGKSLLQHQLDTLRDAGVDATRVSGLRPQHDGIPDLEPDRGPLAGLASIAAATDGDTDLLVVPVDMPLLSGALLRKLIGADPGADACVRFAGHVLPLRLRLDARSRARLHQRMQMAEPRLRSLRALQDDLGLVELPLSTDEATQLADINTPAAWQGIQRPDCD